MKSEFTLFTVLMHISCFIVNDSLGHGISNITTTNNNNQNITTLKRHSSFQLMSSIHQSNIYLIIISDEQKVPPYFFVSNYHVSLRNITLQKENELINVDHLIKSIIRCPDNQKCYCKKHQQTQQLYHSCCMMPIEICDALIYKGKEEMFNYETIILVEFGLLSPNKRHALQMLKDTGYVYNS